MNISKLLSSVGIPHKVISASKEAYHRWLAKAIAEQILRTLTTFNHKMLTPKRIKISNQLYACNSFLLLELLRTSVKRFAAKFKISDLKLAKAIGNVKLTFVDTKSDRYFMNSEGHKGGAGYSSATNRILLPNINNSELIIPNVDDMSHELLHAIDNIFGIADTGSGVSREDYVTSPTEINTHAAKLDSELRNVIDEQIETLKRYKIKLAQKKYSVKQYIERRNSTLDGIAYVLSTIGFYNVIITTQYMKTPWLYLDPDVADFNAMNYELITKPNKTPCELKAIGLWKRAVNDVLTGLRKSYTPVLRFI